MPDAKPADVFLGVLEFFAILVPGSALVYLVQPFAICAFPPQLRPTDATQSGAVFLVLAYIAGHLLHAFGGALDPFYDRIYLRWWQKDHYKAVSLIKKGVQPPFEGNGVDVTLIARAFRGAKEDSAGTSLLNWCTSLVRLRSNPASAEIDRFQADSKLFRSLVLLLTVTAVVSAVGGYGMTAILALLVAAFSVSRFCSQRWKATLRIYEYYLLLHSYPQRAGAAPGVGALEDSETPTPT